MKQVLKVSVVSPSQRLDIAVAQSRDARAAAPADLTRRRGRPLQPSRPAVRPTGRSYLAYLAYLAGRACDKYGRRCRAEGRRDIDTKQSLMLAFSGAEHQSKGR